MTKPLDLYRLRGEYPELEAYLAIDRETASLDELNAALDNLPPGPLAFGIAFNLNRLSAWETWEELKAIASELMVYVESTKRTGRTLTVDVDGIPYEVWSADAGA